MSTFHDAAYVMCRIDRVELCSLVSRVLHRNGMTFEGEVRGLSWDERKGHFVANLSQELEGIQSFEDAVSATADWECACFDIRFSAWYSELYVLSGRGMQQGMEGLHLSFPNAVYEASQDDEILAARWLGALCDFGRTLGRATMICGIEVLMKLTIPDQLFARFTHMLLDFEPEDYRVHTALIRTTQDNERTRRDAISKGFVSTLVDDDYELLTVLRYNNAILRQVVGKN